MIVTGIRRIRKEGITLKRLLLPAIGLCVAIVWLSVSFFAYQSISKIQDLGKTSEVLRSKMESSINSDDLSPEQRAKWSRLYANMMFHDHGVLIEFFTLDGKREFYSPTEKEKKDRDEFVKSNKLLQSVTRGFQRTIYFWSVVIAVSLLLGFFTPVNRKTLNNSVNSDAADPAAQVTP